MGAKTGVKYYKELNKEYINQAYNRRPDIILTMSGLLLLRSVLKFFVRVRLYDATVFRRRVGIELRDLCVCFPGCLSYVGSTSLGKEGLSRASLLYKGRRQARRQSREEPLPMALRRQAVARR